MSFGLKIFSDLFSQVSCGQNSNAWKMLMCVLFVMPGPGTGRRKSNRFQSQACYGNQTMGLGGKGRDSQVGGKFVGV